MARIVLYGILVGLGIFLVAFSSKLRTPIVGWIALMCGLSVFAVRFFQEGPYPIPRGGTLVCAVANLGIGLELVWPRRRTAKARALLTKVLLGVTPIVLLFGLVATLAEVEEVVVLRTHDERGGVRDTRLWVVDYMGSPWVVTRPRAEHVRQLTTTPRVGLLRHGVTRCYIAERHDDRATVEKLLRLRHEKYFVQRLTVAVGLWSRSFDGIEKVAVAIRLEPCP